MRDQQVLYAKTAELGGLQNTIDFFRRVESRGTPSYSDVRTIGNKYAKFRIVGVEGEPQ